MNRCLLKKKKEIQYAYNKSRSQKTTLQRQKFMEFQKLFQSRLKKTYWEYIEDIITVKDDKPYQNQSLLIKKVGKRFWSYIKQLLRDATGTAPLKKNGFLVDNAKGKGTVMNEEYASIFTVEDANIIPSLGDVHLLTFPCYITQTAESRSFCMV